MFGWGIALMAIGGLSFLLPIFGRQFILVSAVGLTGVGSAFAGIVVFFVGLALFIAAGKKKQSDPAEFNQFGERYRRPMGTEPAATNVVPIRAVEEVPLHTDQRELDIRKPQISEREFAAASILTLVLTQNMKYQMATVSLDAIYGSVALATDPEVVCYPAVN